MRIEVPGDKRIVSTTYSGLPGDVTPALAPISTGLGEIVYYTLRYAPGATGAPADHTEQLRQLRLLHDYTIKPLLRSTQGVAEVNAIGGYEKQIVIAPDPASTTSGTSRCTAASPSR